MEEGISHQASKKGDLSLCSNYRGITLLSIPGKVFNRVLLNILKDPVDPHLRNHQKEQISCTSDRHSTHYPGAVIGMELFTFRQFLPLDEVVASRAVFVMVSRMGDVDFDD